MKGQKVLRRMFTFFQSQIPLPHHTEPTAVDWTLSQRQAFTTLGHSLCTVISKEVEAFWGKATHWQFQGLWIKMPKSWQQDFLVSHNGSLPRKGDHFEAVAVSYSLHLNSAFCEEVLTFALGSKTSHTVSPKKTSTLENFLLQHFLESSSEAFLAHLFPEKSIMPTDAPLHSEGMVSFVLTQTDASPQRDSETYSKVILQVPLLTLKATVPHIPSPPVQSWESLFQWQADQKLSFYSPVILVAGLSTLQVAELKTLEVGDLIVLEHSHTQRLGLIHPETQIIQAFSINAPLNKLQQFDARFEHFNSNPQSSKGTHTMMYPHSQVPPETQDSLWDQLHVEVHAEFKPMRLPIQELRHMTQGLLIEVGDLLHNEVQLVTNQNTIAYGRLVVVGDKFGVLLTQVPGQNDTQALLPLGEVPAPLHDLHAVSQHAIHPVEPSHHPIEPIEHHSPSTSDAPIQEQVPAQAVPNQDAELLNYCQVIGLHPKLATKALEVGFTLQQLVDAANEQNVDVNEFFIAAFEQNEIPVPDLGGEDDDLETELNRATEMMEEMEEMLGED